MELKQNRPYIQKLFQNPRPTEMCVHMYFYSTFSYISPTPSPKFLSNTYDFTHPHTHTNFTWSSLGANGFGIVNWRWWTHYYGLNWGQWPFLSQNPSVAVSSAGGTGTHDMSSIHDSMLTGSVVCRTRASSRSCFEIVFSVAVSWTEHRFFFCQSFSPSFNSFILSVPSSMMFSDFRGSQINILFRAQHSTITDSPHCEQLRTAAFSITHTKVKLLWLRLRVALFTRLSIDT